MFLGLPDPDPLVRGMDQDPAPDPNPDPSIIKQKYQKNLDSYCFLTSFGNFFFENKPSKSNKQKNFFKKLVFCWPFEGKWRK
jgi:hypothetical protein